MIRVFSELGHQGRGEPGAGERGRRARPPRCLPHPAAGRARRPMMSCGPARAAAPGLDFARAVAWPRQRTRPSSCTHGRLRERGRVGHHHDGHIMVLTGKKTARPGARGARGAAAGRRRATYGPWRRRRRRHGPRVALPGSGGGRALGGALHRGDPGATWPYRDDSMFCSYRNFS